MGDREKPGLWFDGARDHVVSVGGSSPFPLPRGTCHGCGDAGLSLVSADVLCAPCAKVVVQRGSPIRRDAAPTSSAHRGEAALAVAASLCSLVLAALALVATVVLR